MQKIISLALLLPLYASMIHTMDKNMRIGSNQKDLHTELSRHTTPQNRCNKFCKARDRKAEEKQLYLFRTQARKNKYNNNHNW